MDLIEMALDLEQKTIVMYRELAEQCASHEGIRHILQMLVDDHKEHISSLTRMRDQQRFDSESPAVFKKIRSLLEKIQHTKDTFSCDIDQLNLYRKALDQVGEKQRFYQQIREQLETDGGRRLMDALIKQEDKQAFVLNNIIEMVERPNLWLEDAEFSHLDEY